MTVRGHSVIDGGCERTSGQGGLVIGQVTFGGKDTLRHLIIQPRSRAGNAEVPAFDR